MRRSVVVMVMVVAIGFACASARSGAPTAAIGPHDGTIIFSDQVDGPYPIKAINGDGSNARLLVDPSGGPCIGYDVAPDGTKLVLACAALTILDLKSGARHEIAQFAPGAPAGPVWSPDGRQIALEVQVNGQSLQSGQHSSVVVLNADGSGRHTVSDHGLQPQWTPDSKRILYHSMSSSDGQPATWTFVNADGSGSRPVEGAAVHQEFWNWSPDGTHLEYVVASPGSPANFTAMISAPNGTDVHKLVDGGPFVWSPDSRRLVAFSEASAPEGQYEPFVINRDGTGRKPLIGPGQPLSASVTQIGVCAAWAPDGSRVALADGDVWTIRVKDGRATRLTTEPPGGVACPIHWIA